MIARVVVDSPLPHLDRPFDYEIPEALVAVIDVGSRVRVPFAGRLSSAVVVALSDERSSRKLKEIRSAGAVPSYTVESIELATMIADRYAGSLWDVLRLMAPARVAGVEKLAWASMASSAIEGAGVDALVASAAREGLVAMAGGRKVWPAPPIHASSVPAQVLLGWALAAIQQDGSAIVALPDARAVLAVAEAARAAGLARWTARSGGDFVVLDAEDGASVRFGSHLAALRGVARLVIGTRSAAWQAVPDLRAIALWDEASGTYTEPRAPYPHARTVAAMRSSQGGASLLVGGYALSADAVALVEHGFASRVTSPHDRERLPRVEVVGHERREREGGQGRHWMPASVWAPLLQAARRGTAAVLVPQAGYASGLRCSRCSAWAECAACGGDLLRTSETDSPRCRDCGTEAPHWHCPECRAYRLTPAGLGIERLAMQLSRMAPDVMLTVSSSGTGIVPDHQVEGGIVVATPSALPAVSGGYAELAIVGARITMGEGLGAEAATVRRWINATALVAPRSRGGVVKVVGDLPEGVRRALVACDGWEAAAQDLTQRQELGLPPHRRAMRIEGPPDAVDAVVAAAVGVRHDVARDGEGAWILAGRGAMQAAVDAARSVAVERSARSMTPLYVRVDAVPGL